MKTWILNFCEVIDSLRMVPRLILASYSWLCWDTYHWYKLLPVDERTTDVTAFTGSIFAMATVAASLYLQGGRDWDKYYETHK